MVISSETIQLTASNGFEVVGGSWYVAPPASRDDTEIPPPPFFVEEAPSDQESVGSFPRRKKKRRGSRLISMLTKSASRSCPEGKYDASNLLKKSEYEPYECRDDIQPESEIISKAAASTIEALRSIRSIKSDFEAELKTDDADPVFTPDLVGTNTPKMDNMEDDTVVSESSRSIPPVMENIQTRNSGVEMGIEAEQVGALEQAKDEHDQQSVSALPFKKSSSRNSSTSSKASRRILHAASSASFKNSPEILDDVISVGSSRPTDLLTDEFEVMTNEELEVMTNDGLEIERKIYGETELIPPTDEEDTARITNKRSSKIEKLQEAESKETYNSQTKKKGFLQRLGLRKDKDKVYKHALRGVAGGPILPRRKSHSPFKRFTKRKDQHDARSVSSYPIEKIKEDFSVEDVPFEQPELIANVRPERVEAREDSNEMGLVAWRKDRVPSLRDVVSEASSMSMTAQESVSNTGGTVTTESSSNEGIYVLNDLPEHYKYLKIFGKTDEAEKVPEAADSDFSNERDIEITAVQLDNINKAFPAETVEGSWERHNSIEIAPGHLNSITVPQAGDFADSQENCIQVAAGRLNRIEQLPHTEISEGFWEKRIEFAADRLNGAMEAPQVETPEGSWERSIEVAADHLHDMSELHSTGLHEYSLRENIEDTNDQLTIIDEVPESNNSEVSSVRSKKADVDQHKNYMNVPETEFSISTHERNFKGTVNHLNRTKNVPQTEAPQGSWEETVEVTADKLNNINEVPEEKYPEEGSWERSIEVAADHLNNINDMHQAKFFDGLLEKRIEDAADHLNNFNDVSTAESSAGSLGIKVKAPANSFKSSNEILQTESQNGSLGRSIDVTGDPVTHGEVPATYSRKRGIISQLVKPRWMLQHTAKGTATQDQDTSAHLRTSQLKNQQCSREEDNSQVQTSGETYDENQEKSQSFFLTKHEVVRRKTTGVSAVDGELRNDNTPKADTIPKQEDNAIIDEMLQARSENTNSLVVDDTANNEVSEAPDATSADTTSQKDQESPVVALDADVSSTSEVMQLARAQVEKTILPGHYREGESDEIIDDDSDHKAQEEAQQYIPLSIVNAIRSVRSQIACVTEDALQTTGTVDGSQCSHKDGSASDSSNGILAGSRDVTNPSPSVDNAPQNKAVNGIAPDTLREVSHNSHTTTNPSNNSLERLLGSKISFACGNVTDTESKETDDLGPHSSNDNMSQSEKEKICDVSGDSEASIRKSIIAPETKQVSDAQLALPSDDRFLSGSDREGGDNLTKTLEDDGNQHTDQHELQHVKLHEGYHISQQQDQHVDQSQDQRVDQSQDRRENEHVDQLENPFKDHYEGKCAETHALNRTPEQHCEEIEHDVPKNSTSEHNYHVLNPSQQSRVAPKQDNSKQKKRRKFAFLSTFLSRKSNTRMASDSINQSIKCSNTGKAELVGCEPPQQKEMNCGDLDSCMEQDKKKSIEEGSHGSDLTPKMNNHSMDQEVEESVKDSGDLTMEHEKVRGSASKDRSCVEDTNRSSKIDVTSHSKEASLAGTATTTEIRQSESIFEKLNSIRSLWTQDVRTSITAESGKSIADKHVSDYQEYSSNFAANDNTTTSAQVAKEAEKIIHQSDNIFNRMGSQQSSYKQEQPSVPESGKAKPDEEATEEDLGNPEQIREDVLLISQSISNLRSSKELNPDLQQALASLEHTVGSLGSFCDVAALNSTKSDIDIGQKTVPAADETDFDVGHYTDALVKQNANLLAMLDTIRKQNAKVDDLEATASTSRGDSHVEATKESEYDLSKHESLASRLASQKGSDDHDTVGSEPSIISNLSFFKRKKKQIARRKSEPDSQQSDIDSDKLQPMKKVGSYKRQMKRYSYSNEGVKDAKKAVGSDSKEEFQVKKKDGTSHGRKITQIKKGKSHEKEISQFKKKVDSHATQKKIYSHDAEAAQVKKKTVKQAEEVTQLKKVHDPDGRGRQDAKEDIDENIVQRKIERKARGHARIKKGTERHEKDFTQAIITQDKKASKTVKRSKSSASESQIKCLLSQNSTVELPKHKRGTDVQSEDLPTEIAFEPEPFVVPESKQNKKRRRKSKAKNGKQAAESSSMMDCLDPMLTYLVDPCIDICDKYCFCGTLVDDGDSVSLATNTSALTGSTK